MVACPAVVVPVGLVGAAEDVPPFAALAVGYEVWEGETGEGGAEEEFAVVDALAGACVGGLGAWVGGALGVFPGVGVVHCLVVWHGGGEEGGCGQGYRGSFVRRGKMEADTEAEKRRQTGAAAGDAVTCANEPQYTTLFMVHGDV